MTVGAMAEGLGTGLQNLLQRFDSASHLKKVLYNMLWGTFRFFTPETHFQSPIYTKNLTTTNIEIIFAKRATLTKGIASVARLSTVCRVGAMARV